MKFYMSMECDNCEADIYFGICETLVEHNGLPVISFDFASQTTFVCDECDTKHHTGDFDYLVEGAEDAEAER